MPELPEVETIRRALARRLVGARLESVAVRERRLRLPIAEPELAALIGSRFVAFRRRAKYLLVDTDRRTTLVIHLGMSGRLELGETGRPLAPHDHVSLLLRVGADDRELRYHDPRRFGLVVAVPEAGLDEHRLFVGLGPEPLGAEFSVSYLSDRARGRRAPVKAFLMDARVVVGVGNIYASEALWRAGVHPARAAGRIGAARLARVRDSVREVLQRAIDAGGTTLRDFRDTEGNLGYFAVALNVYDRERDPCPRCGRPIRRIVQSGRATFYCPGCQR